MVNVLPRKEAEKTPKNSRSCTKEGTINNNLPLGMICGLISVVDRRTTLTDRRVEQQLKFSLALSR